MASAPTTTELMAIITQLQVQIVALQNAAPAAAAAPPAGAAMVVFANMPQMLGTNDLIDYSTKQESAIFEQGFKALNNKALTNGFAMTPDQTIIFVEAFHRCTTKRAGTKAPGRSRHLPTAPDVKSTSSRAMAKSARPLSSLHVRGFASLGELIPRPAQSRTTQ
jgi:hypothetical protein